MGQLLFVYGTLKRGCANHFVLQSQRWLVDAQTEPGFALYDLGDYPGLIRSSDQPEVIRGELWQVDDAGLAQLDAFEERGQLFDREAIVVRDETGRRRQVWAYLYRLPLDSAVRIGPYWPAGCTERAGQR